MTEKRFTSKVVDWWHDVDKVRVVFDNGEWIDADNCAKLLNALHEENKQLKKILNELSDMLQFDVENGIRSYPVKLSEYLSNALKELQK